MKNKMDLPPREESAFTEFKKSTSEWKEIVETIAAFGTAKGGTIYVGIRDDGTVVGTQIGRRTIQDLGNKIRQNIDPAQYPEIHRETVDVKQVLVIKVNESMTKPVYAFGKPLKRVGTTNLRLMSEEVRRVVLESNKRYWDGEFNGFATIADIDEKKLSRFLQKAKNERRLKLEPQISLQDALEKLDLIEGDTLKNAAILMFGREPQKFFLQSEVRCAKFKGTKPVKPFLDMRVIDGCVNDQMDECVKFVLDNIHKSAWVEAGNIERREKWEYPPEAIREVITNAIAHRDYRSTANTHISIFDDRIEVWNPGKLPEPLTPEILKGAHKSIPVNPRMASMLFMIRYIERWGTGTNDVMKWCLEHDLPEPMFIEEAGGILVTLRKYKSVRDIEHLGLNERQKRALEYVGEKGSISNREYQNINHVSRQTATRDLKRLMLENLLQMVGTGKRDRRYVIK